MKSMRNEAVLLLSPASLPPFKQKLGHTPSLVELTLAPWMDVLSLRTSHSSDGNGEQQARYPPLASGGDCWVAFSDVLCCQGQHPLKGRLSVLSLDVFLSVCDDYNG